jgi:lysine 2,3-aminomutase
MTAEIQQPFDSHPRDLSEPDWTRFPGWRDVSDKEWRSVQWQRAHSVKGIAELRALLGDLVGEPFYADLEADQRANATMSILVTPQMLNTMVPAAVPCTESWYADPIRRYMLPAASDRRIDWPSHPCASRDSLHEKEMWVGEGLTRRYPAKVLAELLATCPQYCGHCTRMDLVGKSTPSVAKIKLSGKPVDRQHAILAYLRAHLEVTDVVVSGGDVANMPWPRLEQFLVSLLEIETVRDIRLATKALAGLPQHWLDPFLLGGLERVAGTAARRGVSLAIHTHINHVNSVTLLVADAARAALDAGVRDVRNQGVLLRGVNATTEDLLSLCCTLQGKANILPYYFYLCDMIPNAEHWRIPVWEAQRLQHDILGYLPGYATPRIVCDVPYVGKRWVHMVARYDRERGISYWTKSYRTAVENGDSDALSRQYAYYDPVDTLPEPGRRWWSEYAVGRG